MDKVTVQLILIGLASVYVGLHFFIADVLNGVFKTMEEITFVTSWDNYTAGASRSTVIILGGAVPFFGMFAATRDLTTAGLMPRLYEGLPANLDFL